MTGTKYQLFITDKSGNAAFSGLTLDEGGLWDVTPTIQNGQYVHDVMGVTDANDKQWYLTKLEKKVKKDTVPLMKAADNSYALYRLDVDSLRKRMGDLRFRNMKDDSGIWARDFHGAYEGQGGQTAGTTVSSWDTTMPPMKRAFTVSSQNGIFPIRNTAMVLLRSMSLSAAFTAPGLETAVYTPTW